MKPIIFIPGIEATSLVDSNSFDFEIRWNAFDTWGTAISNKITGPIIEDKLQLDPQFDEDINRIIERNHLARLPYEKSIRYIAQKFPKDPVYLFGYDWRMSNVKNAARLDTYVRYLQEKLKSNNVEGFRFITHSMGGLVFSCYLTQLGDDFTHIDKVVMCAPPFRGSPLSLVHMVKGDAGIKGFFRRIFGQRDDIRKVVRTYPSLFELLPWYPGAIKFTDGSPVDLTKKDQWQSNIYRGNEELFQERLDKLVAFRDHNLKDFSQLPEDVRKRITVLAGNYDGTLIHLSVKQSGGETANYVQLDDLKSEDYGDGTVPFQSSAAFVVSVRTLEVKVQNFFKEFGDAVDFHGMFLTDSRVQNIICRALDDSPGGISYRQNHPEWWKSLDNSVVNISGF